MSKTKRRKYKTIKTPSLHELRIKALRRGSQYWKYKHEARNLAKRRVQVGFWKNGNPKFEVKYECACCKGLFIKKQTSVDHIAPVVDTEDGFIGWEAYIPRLLCELDNLQVLCRKPCHAEKTARENAERGIHKKVKKSNKKA